MKPGLVMRKQGGQSSSSGVLGVRGVPMQRSLARRMKEGWPALRCSARTGSLLDGAASGVVVAATLGEGTNRGGGGVTW